MKAVAESIVEGILEELSGRSDIGNALDQCDDDVLNELGETLTIRVLQEIYSCIEGELERLL